VSRLAVVTIAHGRHDHLHLQHRSLAGSSRRPDVYVVVAMSDPELERWPTVDGLRPRVVPITGDLLGLPLAAARNLGLDLAVDAGCEVLVGLDVDCLVSPTALAAYEQVVLAEPDRVWAGPVTYLGPPPDGGYPLHRIEELDDPHPVRPAPAPGQVLRGGDRNLFWSLSFALSAATWRRSGGFDEAYVGYGGEDTDFGRRLAERGVDLAWVGAARAYHQHHPDGRAADHLDDILRNGRTFRDRWGTWPMLGWLEELERSGLVERRGDDWVRAARVPHLYD
jgi:N-acetylglucosaminyl-diphospho-decaprenol L-rhamnosyltransferase